MPIVAPAMSESERALNVMVLRIEVLFGGVKNCRRMMQGQIVNPPPVENEANKAQPMDPAKQILLFPRAARMQDSRAQKCTGMLETAVMAQQRFSY